eukprot:3921228-Alexandrium_andersonii.AAC.1
MSHRRHALNTNSCLCTRSLQSAVLILPLQAPTPRWWCRARSPQWQCPHRAPRPTGGESKYMTSVRMASFSASSGS